MLVSIIKGLNVFRKKFILPVILFTAIYIIAFFTSDYLLNLLANAIDFSSLDLLTTMSIAPIFFHIMELFGFYLVLLVFLFFILFSINNYIVYIIISIISNKKNIKNTAIVFRYCLVFFLILCCFGFLYSLLLLKITTIAIIFLILLTLLLFIVLYVFFLALFFMGSENDLSLKKGLQKAWLFLKKKFWLITIFIILLAIILEAINLTVFLLLVPFLEILEIPIIETIFFFVYSLFILLFSTSSLAIFINKHKKKI